MTADKLPYKECKELLKNIKDLEISCYQQERLIKKLKKLPDNTKREIRQLENQLQTERPPEKPMGVMEDFFGSIVGSFILALLGALGGAAVACIVKIILNIYNYIHWTIHEASDSNFIIFFFRIILNLFKDHESSTAPWLTYIFWGAVIGGGILLLFAIVIYVFGIKDAKQKRISFPERQQKHAYKMQEIERQIGRKKQVLEVSIPNQITKAQQFLDKTRKVLNDYYSLGVVHPRYCGLVPICTIYEYLETGKCFSLTGHEGAYNLYDYELKMDMIVGKLDGIYEKLDEISNKLSAVIANQHELINAVKQSDERVENLLKTVGNSLDRIENNAALSAYYNQISAENTAYANLVMAFKSR